MMESLDSQTSNFTQVLISLTREMIKSKRKKKICKSRRKFKFTILTLCLRKLMGRVKTMMMKRFKIKRKRMMKFKRLSLRLLIIFMVGGIQNVIKSLFKVIYLESCTNKTHSIAVYSVQNTCRAPLLTSTPSSPNSQTPLHFNPLK